MKVVQCFYILLFFFGSVECGQTCLSCTGVETLSDCHTHETCTDDEVCFKTEYRTNSGAMLFDLGCSNSQFCRQQSLGIIFGRRSEGHHLMCGACCNNTILCNGKLICDTNPVKLNISNLPRDCSEIAANNLKRGVYNIYPLRSAVSVPVYCESKGSNNETWTVIQRRYNGSVNFYRNWNSYKEGFGSPYGEYWLGNDIIHELTSNGHHKLYIELSDFDGTVRYAEFDSFSVSDERNGYRLHATGYSGNVGGNILDVHTGMMFSTFDHDNDKDVSGSCAEIFKGGWWYNTCHRSNLNGLYLAGHHDSFADGIDVYYWHGYYYSIKSVTIMTTHNNVK